MKNYSKMNYRIIIKDGFYSIHECCYNQKGCPKSISTNPINPEGESFKALKLDFKLMGLALEKPALMWDDFN